MTMQGRNFVSTAYRYGYQGSEKDGELNSGMYTTEFRALDVRLGRWFSPDPITHFSWSPYVSMNDDPINLTDVLGLDPIDPDPPISGPNDGCTGNECSADDYAAGLEQPGTPAEGFGIIGGNLDGLGSSNSPFELNAVEYIDFSEFNTPESTTEIVLTRDAEIAAAFALGTINAVGSNLNPLELIPFFSQRKDPRDVFPGDWQLQIAFGSGQIAGDVTSAFIADAEITAGGTVALTTGVTGVGAVAGGVVALHGGMVLINATAGTVKTTAILLAINTNASGENSSDGNAVDGGGGASSSDQPNGTYEPANYHGKKSSATKSKAPKNGQNALNRSKLVKKKANGEQRIAIEDGEFVVFDSHSNGKFHGHVRSWEALSQDQKNALIENGLTKPNGKIK